jgi:hypothetical protein
MKIFKTLSLLFFTVNLFSQCPPDVQASMVVQTLTCNSPTLLATGTSTTPNTQISWLVPSTPSLINSSTVIIGPPNGPPTSSLSLSYANYTVVATNTLLACSNTSVIQINQNFKPPYFEVKGTSSQSIICNNLGLTLYMSKTYTGSPMPWEILTNLCWSGPSPQTPTCSFYYNANTAGIYSLTGIDSYNGCSSTNTMMVFEGRPQYNLSGIAPTSSVSCNGSLNINTQITSGYSLTTTSGSLSGNTVSNLCYGWVKVCMTYTDTQCFKCDSLLMNAATSINELNYENEISIYPNPASSSVFIQHPSNISGTITLLNIEGKEIKSLSFKESDNTKITNLEAGIYFVEIGINHSVIRRKLVVLR